MSTAKERRDVAITWLANMASSNPIHAGVYHEGRFAGACLMYRTLTDKSADQVNALIAAELRRRKGQS